jgi:putative addiction module CopG family antidote
LKHRHKLSHDDAIPVTSLNISLPEALKDYVEGQVASGDWGTPSEYVRELIRQFYEKEFSFFASYMARAIWNVCCEIRQARPKESAAGWHILSFPRLL